MPDETYNPTEVQPDAGQGQGNDTPNVQPNVGQGGEGPWSASLQTSFEDEGTRAQVDAYLRQNVQPYVTQLEQGRAPEGASELYSDYQSDPIETHLAVTEQLYGPDARAAVEAALFGEGGEDQEADSGDTPYEPQSGRDPEVQALLDREAERENEKVYYDAMVELAEADPNFNEDEFSPFVLGTEGDLQGAYQAYTNWRGKVQERYAPQTPAPDIAGAEPVPPVLGSTAPGGSPPPTQKHYDSLDDAVDDWFAESKAVGSGSL